MINLGTHLQTLSSAPVNIHLLRQAEKKKIPGMDNLQLKHQDTWENDIFLLITKSEWRKCEDIITW